MKFLDLSVCVSSHLLAWQQSFTQSNWAETECKTYSVVKKVFAPFPISFFLFHFVTLKLNIDDLKQVCKMMLLFQMKVLG